MSRVYRATIKCESYGISIQPTLHYKVDVPAAGEEPPANDVAGTIWGIIGDSFRAVTPSDCTLRELTVTQVVLPGEIAVAGTHSIELDGFLASGDQKLPIGMCAFLNIHSNAASRSGRGGMHPPGPRNSTYSNGQTWSSSYVTLLTSLCNQLDNTGQTPGTIPCDVVPVVYSRTRHRASQEPWTFDVTSATPNHVPKWLRSRMTAP